MARNKGEFDRGAMGMGESSRRAIQDAEQGTQARAHRDEDVEEQRDKLRDAGGDGGGAVGAQHDGRSLRQPDAVDADEREQDERHERRGLEDAAAHERKRLYRK